MTQSGRRHNDTRLKDCIRSIVSELSPYIKNLMNLTLSTTNKKKDYHSAEECEVFTKSGKCMFLAG